MENFIIKDFEDNSCDPYFPDTPDRDNCSPGVWKVNHYHSKTFKQMCFTTLVTHAFLCSIHVLYLQ
jgi:hypothetical protein